MHHVSNGTGRDSYINFSSGGMFAQYEPRQQPKPRSFYPMKVYRPKTIPNPVMEAKPIHYAPDGSGRDRYIE